MVTVNFFYNDVHTTVEVEQLPRIGDGVWIEGVAEGAAGEGGVWVHGATAATTVLRVKDVQHRYRSGGSEIIEYLVD